MSDNIISINSDRAAADTSNFQTAAFETSIIKPIGTEQGDLIAKSIAELLKEAATSTGGENLAFINVLYREWKNEEVETDNPEEETTQRVLNHPDSDEANFYVRLIRNKPRENSMIITPLGN